MTNGLSGPIFDIRNFIGVNQRQTFPTSHPPDLILQVVAIFQAQIDFEFGFNDLIELS